MKVRSRAIERLSTSNCLPIEPTRLIQSFPPENVDSGFALLFFLNFLSFVAFSLFERKESHIS